jgi:hypothetical protein
MSTQAGPEIVRSCKQQLGCATSQDRLGHMSWPPSGGTLESQSHKVTPGIDRSRTARDTATAAHLIPCCDALPSMTTPVETRFRVQAPTHGTESGRELFRRLASGQSPVRRPGQLLAEKLGPMTFRFGVARPTDFWLLACKGSAWPRHRPRFGLGDHPQAPENSVRARVPHGWADDIYRAPKEKTRWSSSSPPAMSIFRFTTADHLAFFTGRVPSLPDFRSFLNHFFQHLDDQNGRWRSCWCRCGFRHPYPGTLWI